MFECENLEMSHTLKKSKNILLIQCKEKRKIKISKIARIEMQKKNHQ